MATHPNPATRLQDGVYQVYRPGGFEDIEGPREIFIGADRFLTHTGSGALTGTAAGSGNMPGWALDKTTDEVLTAFVRLPDGWKNYSISVVWSNASTGAGGVRWNVNYEATAIGAARGAGTDASATGTASTTAFLLVETAILAAAAAAVATEATLTTFKLSRDADHAGDTLDNDAIFHGIQLTKV